MISLPISILIIAEGYEEEAYLNKLVQFPCFPKDRYKFEIKNAKGNGNIAPKYQLEYSKNKYDLILVFCDGDNNSDQYNKQIVEDICVGIFNDISLEEDLIIFTNPVTLQIVLSHFNEVTIKHTAKKKNAPAVKKLTDVDNYDAERRQVDAIIKQINYKSYEPMKYRISQLSTNKEDSPSTNFIRHLNNFENTSVGWVETLLERLNTPKDE